MGNEGETMELNKQFLNDLGQSVGQWSVDHVVGLTDDRLTPAFYQVTKEYCMVWNDLLRKLRDALILNEKATGRDEIWLEDIVLDVVDLVAALENRDNAQTINKLRSTLLMTINRYK